MKEPKYSIGDKVYHITPESDCGIVLDASFSMLNNRWMYLISFGIKDNDYWYHEHEISTTKTF